MNVDLYAEARDWIADCAWSNLEPEDIEELSDERVRRGIERHYHGGWEAFVETCDGAGGSADAPLANSSAPAPRRRPSALAERVCA